MENTLGQETGKWQLKGRFLGTSPQYSLLVIYPITPCPFSTPSGGKVFSFDPVKLEMLGGGTGSTHNYLQCSPEILNYTDFQNSEFSFVLTTHPAAN